MHVDASGSLATTVGAIRHAARLTGTSFQYLLATAQIESSLNPNAKVSTSSARGLFQFIEQTWLGTLKQHGTALGYGPYADSIRQLPSGRYAVTDPVMRQRIMNLRSDPTASAVMGGVFTRTNAAKLAERLGRNPTEGELYIAHFLGPGGGARLIANAQQRPSLAAAQLFPGAARANPTIFYDRQGHARSTSAVYRTLVGRYDIARTSPAGAPARELASLETSSAGVVPEPQSVAAASAATARGASSAPIARTSFAEAAPGWGPATREESLLQEARRESRQAPPQPFRSLFSTGGRPEPVAPLVTALWSTPAQATEPAPSRPRTTKNGLLDLFQNRPTNAGALFRGRG